MKKRMSAAALGLRMTWKYVLILILVTCAAQLWAFESSRVYWSGVDGWSNDFEWVLDEYHVGFIGKMSFHWILGVIIAASGTGKSRMSYTLRRLRISENEITVQWAAVFAGYFLISWAVQLALVFWMYSQYQQAVQWVWQLTGLDLFVIIHRSAYFHTLLPLSEPWGFVRNIVLCLGWGTMGSLLARNIRHGGRPIAGIIMLLAATILLLPGEMATADTDGVFLLAMAVVITVQILMNREVERNAG